MKSYSVGILGGTGLVGQHFIKILENHPWLKVKSIAARRSVGKFYGESVNWLLGEKPPKNVLDIEVVEAKPSKVDADIVFSALPAEAALSIEAEFAKSGFPVFSNTRAYRMEKDVPLMIPDVNPNHLALIDVQRRGRGWDGYIVTDPNCSTVILATVLKPLHDCFRIKRVYVATMQAVSGAGYPGIPVLDIFDNVIPYIKGEEEKIESETLKILGELTDKGIKYADLQVSASCNRVPTLDGHMESIFIEFEGEVELSEVIDKLDSFKSEPQELRLPTAPEKPIIVRMEENRPQTRLDRLAGSIPGMSVTVGRIRHSLDRKSIKLSALGHNLIRGAAGSAVLTAELAIAKKYV